MKINPLKINPFEQARRFTKTARMVAQIDASVLFWNLDPFMHSAQIVIFLMSFDERKWLTVATASGVPRASKRTIAAILEVFETRAHRVNMGIIDREKRDKQSQKDAKGMRQALATLTGRARKGT